MPGPVAPTQATPTRVVGSLNEPGARSEAEWHAVLRRPPSELVLAHELGSQYDPQSIYGRERLTAHPDGWLEVRFWQDDQLGAWSARVDPSIVTRWAELLAMGSFPNFPARPITPGASFRVFEVKLGDDQARASLSRYHFESVPPYKELCAIADSVVAQIRGRKCWADPDPAKGLVHDIQRIDP